MHELDFFFGFGGRISANTTDNFNKICTNSATSAVYNLVIMKSLMDCLARQLCDYFTSTILQTIDFCAARPRVTIHDFKAVTCKNCIVKVFLLSEREISPNYTGIFLDFVHGFGSYVKGLPKTKRCNSVVVTVSVRFRFGFGIYVKRPLVNDTRKRLSKILKIVSGRLCRIHIP